MFCKLPSYRWAPSRSQSVRPCAFQTTAIMPFGPFPRPSRRKVLSCSPRIPGGRGPAAVFPCRPINDSKGSRRACLISLSVAAGAEPGVEGFSPPLTAGFPGGFLALAFAAGFAADLPAGLPPGLAACGAGLVAVGAAALGACCACLPASPSADFTLLGVDGLTCARKPGVAAAIKIPSPRVIAERIVRSFPLRVSQPRRLQACLRLTELHPYPQPFRTHFLPAKFQKPLFPSPSRPSSPSALPGTSNP